MKRIVSILAIATAFVLTHSCQVASFVAHGSIPDSISVTRIDNVAGAKGLAVMQVGSGLMTKADGEGGQNRLCIVGGDGQTELASFSFDEKGLGTNSLWKEIRKTLTLVPNRILKIYDNYLLLMDTCPDYAYTDWHDDALSGKEVLAIDALLSSLGGDYLLRISDGALFRSPFNPGEHWPMPKELPEGATEWCFQQGPDNTMVYGGYFETKSRVLQFLPVIVRDNGNEMVSTSLPFDDTTSPVNSNGYFVTKEGRIFCLQNGDRTISYDLDLKPLYLDYGESFKKISLWPSPITFIINQRIYALSYSDKASANNVTLSNIYLEGYEIKAKEICSVEIDSNVLDKLFSSSWYESDRANVSMNHISNGVRLYYTGGILTVDVVNASIAIDSYPEDFPQSLNDYDSDGLAWELTDNYTTITKYDINSRTKSSIPVKWGNISLNQFYDLSSSYVPGLFYVVGHNRDLTYSTFIVDAETGSVSDAGESNSASVPEIKTYVRLN
jgi:hypothetical protein